MPKTTKNISFSNIIKEQVYRSEQFRTPLLTEKKLGLWVDRIGEGVNNVSEKLSGLRQLGLYGAVYIEEGQGIFITKNHGKYTVGPGDIMLLFPEEPHVYFSRQQWKTKWIVWGGPEADIIREIGYVLSSHPVIPDKLGLFNQAFEKLIPIITQENIGVVFLRKNIILEMICGLYSYLQIKGEQTYQSKVMQEVVLFIKANFIKPLSVSELALQFNMSVTHFRRLFRHYTGISPSRFITSLRISEAKWLLSQQINIKEVAFYVGYTNIFYFMRVFKKMTGTTAGRFTETIKKQL